jgi:hypothetical protein
MSRLNAFFLLVVVLGFVLMDFHLLGRHATAWAMYASSSLYSDYFVWATIPLLYVFYLSWKAGTTGKHHHAPSPPTAFFPWDGILWTFLPQWLGTVMFLSSASQISQIPGMSLQQPALNLANNLKTSATILVFNLALMRKCCPTNHWQYIDS